MTPKVGDKFKITKSNFGGQGEVAGSIVTYVRERFRPGLGEFLTDSGLKLTFAYEGNGNYPCHVVPYIHVPTPQDPIEYLKTAHANGDIINPEEMLRECYGIAKTERVVTEWSEVKREIKVGDRVRIVGKSCTDRYWPNMEYGSIHIIDDVDQVITDPKYPYLIKGYWFPASSVELV